MYKVYFINSIDHSSMNMTFNYWYEAQKFMDALGMWFVKWEKIEEAIKEFPSEK